MKPGWRRTRGLLLVAPAIAVIGLLFLVPIVRLLFLSFGEDGFSVAAYESLFSTSVYVDSLARTVEISAMVTVAALLLGYPIGYVLATCGPTMRALLGLGVVLPFWTSILVRNFAWIYLLQRRGLVNDLLISSGLVDQPLRFMFNETGVVIGMTNALLPFMVLPIFVAIHAQDRALRETAASLGASPPWAFLTVTLPLSLSGIYAGSLLVFATAMGFFVTPALLGGGKVLMAATFITREIETYVNWPLAAAASVILLFIVTAIIAVYAWLVSVERIAGMADADA